MTSRSLSGEGSFRLARWLLQSNTTSPHPHPPPPFSTHPPPPRSSERNEVRQGEWKSEILMRDLYNNGSLIRDLYNRGSLISDLQLGNPTFPPPLRSPERNRLRSDGSDWPLGATRTPPVHILGAARARPDCPRDSDDGKGGHRPVRRAPTFLNLQRPHGPPQCARPTTRPTAHPAETRGPLGGAGRSGGRAP